MWTRPAAWVSIRRMRSLSTVSENTSKAKISNRKPRKSDEKINEVLRQKLDSLRQPLNIKTMEDFYEITAKKIVEVDPSLPYYIWGRGAGTLHEALATAYPDHTWHPWRFKMVPNGFWNSKENRKMVLDHIANMLGVKQLDDWYRVSEDQFLAAAGGRSNFLSRHKYSLRILLQEEFPEHQWAPWKFVHQKKAANGYLKNPQLQREMLNWTLENDLKKHQLADWYDVKYQDIKTTAVRTLSVDYYGGSVSRMLSAVYPEHPWKSWLFKSSKGTLWRDPGQICEWIDWICRLKNVKSLSEVSLDDMKKNGGNALVKKFKTVEGILAAAQSTAPLESSKRDEIDLTKSLQYLKKLSALCDADPVLENFYNASREHLAQSGFQKPIILFLSLKAAYPNHLWDPWRFRNLSIPFTPSQAKDKALHRRFFEWAAGELSIKDHTDWYITTGRKVIALGGRPILRVYLESLCNALVSLFPEHPWDLSRFNRRKTTAQSSRIAAGKTDNPGKEV